MVKSRVFMVVVVVPSKAAGHGHAVAGLGIIMVLLQEVVVATANIKNLLQSKPLVLRRRPPSPRSGTTIIPTELTTTIVLRAPVMAVLVVVIR